MDLDRSIALSRGLNALKALARLTDPRIKDEENIVLEVAGLAALLDLIVEELERAAD